MSLGPDSFPEPRPDREITEQAIKAVALERRQYFQALFGDFPRIMEVKEELRAIWPDGGVIDFTAPKLNNIRVTASFGLSNLDMPRTQRIASFRETFDGQEHMQEWTLEPFVEPMPTMPGRSGYGYEFICLSRSEAIEGEVSPEARLIFQFVKAQLSSHRENNLDRAWHNGARVFSFEQSDAPEQHYILAPAWDLVPESFKLSSGAVCFMMMIRLTKDEIEYFKHAGANRMLEAFRASGVLPICDDERASVI